MATRSDVAEVAELLGGERVLKHRVRSGLEMVLLLRKGLPYRSIESVARALDLSVDAMADALRLPRRTIARRRQTGDLLTEFESERVLRTARVLARATDVLGSVEKARHWLRTGNRALGGAQPLDLLDADVGAQAVEDVLGRIEHGIVG